MRVLVTRPEDDAGALADTLEGRGIEVLLEPLITITYRDDAEPDLTGIQAILITSANGARALAKATDQRGLPVYAVGDATARAAREAGFQQVESAAGDVEALANLVADKLDPGAGPLYHAAGSSLAGDLAGKLGESGFEVRRGVLYDAETARALTPAAVAAIKAGKLDGVLMFSPRTAAAFADLARQARLVKPARNLTAYCLSKAVAEAATDLPWREVKVASQPTQEALVALLEGTDTAPPPQAQAAPAGNEPENEDREDQGEEEAMATSGIPQSPAPGVTIVPPSRSRSGLTAFFVSVVVLAVFVGGLAATMPYWVPEFARFLPSQPPPPPDPRLAQLAGRFDTLEQQARDRQQEVAARRAENSRALADLEGERQRLNRQLEAALARVDSLEQALADVRGEVEKATAEPRTDTAAEETLKALSERLARIEESGLKASVQDREKIEALAGKVRDLEAQSAARRQMADKLEFHALDLAVRQLRAALDGPRPFSDQLAGLKSVAADNAEIARIADELAPYAASGVPTLTELRARFEKLSADISRPVLGPRAQSEEPGWIDRLLARLGQLVRVQRVGNEAGNGNGAALARAESRLAGGNLEGAVTALDALDAAAKSKAADWLDGARARVAAEHALARLRVLAASRKPAADG